MSERTDAIHLANKLLEEPNTDPDDDLRMLSRQLLRRCETIDRLEKHLAALQDSTLDMINANRDTILRIHEDGLRRLTKQCEILYISLSQSDSPPPIVIKDLREQARLALKIIEAINTFHPMHGESWIGWPEP